MTRHVLTLVRKEALALRSDRRFLLFLFVLPLVMVAFLSQAMEHMLPSGAGHLIPGMAVMFGFYVMTYLGVSHYREHACGWWKLVRSIGLGRVTLVAGLVLPYFLLSVGQILVVVLVGHTAFGTGREVAWPWIPVLAVATALAAVGLGLVLLRISNSLQVLAQFNHLFVLLGGILGGALVPFSVLPTWAATIGYGTPQHWAIEGFRTALGEPGAHGPGFCAAVVAVFGLALLTAAASAFDVETERTASMV